MNTAGHIKTRNLLRSSLCFLSSDNIFRCTTPSDNDCEVLLQQSTLSLNIQYNISYFCVGLLCPLTLVLTHLFSAIARPLSGMNKAYLPTAESASVTDIYIITVLIFLCPLVLVLFRDAKILSARSPWRLNFARWRLILFGSQYAI